MITKRVCGVLTAVIIVVLAVGLSVYFLLPSDEPQDKEEQNDGDFLCLFNEATGTYQAATNNFTQDPFLDYQTLSPCVGDQFVETSVFKDLEDIEGIEEEETYTTTFSASFLKAGIVGLAASEEIIKSLTCREGAIEIVFSMPVDSQSIESMFPDSSVVAVDGIVFDTNCTLTPAEQTDDDTPLFFQASDLGAQNGLLLVHNASLDDVDTVTLVGEGVSMNYLFQERSIVYEPLDNVTDEVGERQLNEVKKFLKEYAKDYVVGGVSISVGVDPTATTFKPRQLRSVWRLKGERWWQFDPYVDYILVFRYEFVVRLDVKVSMAAGLSYDYIKKELPLIGFVPIPTLGFKLPRLFVKSIQKFLPKYDITGALGVGFEMPFSVSLSSKIDAQSSVSSGVVLSSGESIYRFAYQGVPLRDLPTFDLVTSEPATATAIPPDFQLPDGKMQLSLKVGGKPTLAIDAFGLGSFRIGWFSGLQVGALPFLLGHAPPILDSPGAPSEINCEECHELEFDITLVGIGDAFAIGKVLGLSFNTTNTLIKKISFSPLTFPVFKICSVLKEELTCGEICCKTVDTTCAIGDDGKGTCDEPTDSPMTAIPNLPPVALPPMATPFKVTRGTSDPHFFTWNGMFSYQGACDLVYVETDLIKVHIRTTLSGTQHFSYISSVAVSIGGDIFEVDVDRTYFVNKQKIVDLPSEVGGYPLSARGNGPEISIDLGKSQNLRISFYLVSITLEIRGRGVDFSNSKGITGSFFQNMAVKRDGSLFQGEPEDIASEWLVDSSLGDELLFVEGPPHEGCMEAQPFTNTDLQVLTAEQACFRFQGENFENCKFDVLASGNTAWALNQGLAAVEVPLENDTCDLATPISLPYNVEGSTVDALPDIDSSACSFSAGRTNGIWYSFTASANMLVRAEITDVSSLDAPALRVFSGECDSLVCIVRGFNVRRGETAVVTWAADAGVLYQILVSQTWPGFMESFKLSVQGYEVPENDTCDSSSPISLPFNAETSTVGALPDVDDATDCALYSPSNGIWFRLTPSTNSLQKAEITNGNSALRVYSGDCDSLVCVGLESTPYFRGVEVTWAAEAGVTYHLLVSSSTFGVGVASMMVSVQDYDVPENDTCDFATPISLPYNGAASTVGALPDADDTDCALDDRTNGIWYRFTPSTKTLVQARILGAPSSAYPVVRVYSGDCDPLVCVTLGTRSMYAGKIWPAEAGVSYHILVSDRTFGVGMGSFNLSVQGYEVPENDSCDLATSLSLPSEMEGSTMGAFPDIDETNCALAVTTNGVWYSFTASTTSLVRAQISDTPRGADPVLRVYSGECDSLVCVDKANISSQGLEVTWAAVEGVRYKLLVSEKWFSVGMASFKLSVQALEVLENDGCATATSISLPYNAEATTVGAFPDSDETSCALVNYPTNGIWYSYTPSSSSLVTAEVSGAYYADPAIRVYSGECNSLVCVARAYNWSEDVDVTWVAEAGVTYQLLVSDRETDVIESFQLSVQAPEVPENDTCDLATAISLPYNEVASTIGALPDSDESQVCDLSSYAPTTGIWYRFTASTAGLVSARITGVYYVALRVFSGTCDSLVCFGKRYVSNFYGEVTWEAEAGVTYQILASCMGLDGVGVESISIEVDYAQ